MFTFIIIAIVAVVSFVLGKKIPSIKQVIKARKSVVLMHQQKSVLMGLVSIKYADSEVEGVERVVRNLLKGIDIDLFEMLLSAHEKEVWEDFWTEAAYQNMIRNEKEADVVSLHVEEEVRYYCGCDDTCNCDNRVGVGASLDTAESAEPITFSTSDGRVITLSSQEEDKYRKIQENKGIWAALEWLHTL